MLKTNIFYQSNPDLEGFVHCLLFKRDVFLLQLLTKWQIWRLAPDKDGQSGTELILPTQVLSKSTSNNLLLRLPAQVKVILTIFEQRSQWNNEIKYYCLSILIYSQPKLNIGVKNPMIIRLKTAKTKLKSKMHPPDSTKRQKHCSNWNSTEKKTGQQTKTKTLFGDSNRNSL